MANKFYYNGNLVRTSQNHVYTHATVNINNGELYGCSSTLQGAQKIINERLHWAEEEIENAKVAIKALKSGKNGCYMKEGRRSYPHRFGKDDTIEKYEGWIANSTKRIEWVRENLRVVELEMR